MFNYINIDTQNLMSYRDDNYKNSYTTRLIGKKEVKSISDNVIGIDYRVSKLSLINPLLPKEVFGSNDEISYMRFGNKDGVGIAFVGKFREGSNNPDEISVYLGRETGIGDNVGFTLFKKLKDTPGFQDFYKYGNSYYTSKSRMVFGGDNSRDGVTIMKNSGYELVQMARMFFKKSKIEDSKEWKLMESIRRSDFGAIDDKPYYPKSDSWSIKTDKLTSGSLETAVFDMSQITDASILKPKASIGEQYNVKSFFNNQIFDKVKSTIKRESSSNRISFSKFLNGMEDKPITAAGLREALVKHESEQLDLAFSPFNEAMKNTIFSEKERKIKGIELLSSFKKSDDFINKKEMMKDEMKDLISKKIGVDKNSANEKLSTFIFSNKEIASISSKVDAYYKDVEDIYKNKLKDVIKSKINESIDDDKYNILLSSTSKENFKPTVNLLNNESVMKFYDKYNLKLDMLDIINDRRSKTNFSENEIDALKVKIIRDNTGKITDINDVINPHSKKNNTVYSKQDAEDAWAYVRAKSRAYNVPFKEMDIETKLKHMEEYKKNYNSIFETHKEKTLLGKYDSVDNFNKAFEKMSLDMRRESNSGTSLSRTYDKITGNIDYETNNLILNTRTIEKFEKDKMWINFNIKIDDGFDRSDYIKYIQQDKQAVMKEMSLEDQKYISKITSMYRENNRLQKSIGNLIVGLERNKKDNYIENKEELLGFKSILKGDNVEKRRYLKILEEGNLKSEKRYKLKEGKYNYSDLYKSIINILDKKYNHTFYSDFSKESTINSETALLEKIMKIGKESNNTVFNMIMNNDDIINTTGASKQTGVIGGDTYMGHLGSVLPGVAWNKVTQRTFQAQDLLGERTLNIKNSNGEIITKTRSAINAELLSRTKLTGVGSRKAFYKTEELVKDTIEHIRKENKLKDMPYKRGETYKTFAIGDVRAILPEEGNINAFTASFQEGMTATRALQSTTNSIRNKSVKINLDELNYESLGMSKLEVHNLLKTEVGMNQILSKVLSNDLFGTIEGRKKLENFYEDLNNSRVIKNMDGSIGSLQTAYSFINKELGGKSKIVGDISNDEAGKMKLTKGIMDLLDSADNEFKSTAYAKGKNGKVNITNDEFTTKHLSLKPEVGFSVGSASYNAQESAIELMLENIGSVDQGSKQQTTGAKYTISEVYDFIKVKSKDKELYVDAIFNNKAEKRMQTGMMIHGALQTMVTNVYEDLGTEGIKSFNKEMKELLNDLGVEIKLSKEFGVLIDETYLTKDMKGNSLTAEKFLELSKEPIENQNKIFTEKGKEILEKVEKKYGASFYSPDGELKKGQVAQYGILAKMQQSYSAVYNSFDRKETAFMIGDATLEGFSDGKSSGFGNGPVLLLKLASERVNSNANKKKDSGLKVGKGINEMIRINGYNQLADYIDSKNQDKVNEYLGTVYNNLTNSEVLNKIYDYKQDINMDELTESVAKSTNNGIVFDLNSMSKDDYILNKTDAFLSHDKLMKDSILGKKMVENSLDSVSNGKLENNVNVIINDKNINEFAKSLKNKLDVTMEYFRTSDNKFSKKILNSLEGISNLNNLTDTEIEEVSSYIKTLNPEIYKEVNKLKSSVGNELEVDALITTSELLNVFSNNSKNKYSLNQLQTIFKTGNVLTSMELSYDVSESDGTIVSSEVFSRLRNIVDKSKEYEIGRRTSYDFMFKALNKEEGITEKTFREYIDYFENNSDSLEDVSTFNRLINKSKFDNDKTKAVVSEIKTNLDKKKLHSISVINANKFIKEKMNTIDKNNSEFGEIVREIDTRLSSEMNDILESNKKIAEVLTDKEVSKEIISKLNRAIFNGEELSDGVKFSDVFREEVGNQTSKGFDLLKEYIKIPDEAKGLHKNKGKLSSSQKFKIKSSFIANPLEGSNLLNKFENIMFEDVKNVDDIKQNLEEFGDFMGFKLVNEKLFVEDGVDYLENLSGSDGSFKSGLEKAKQVFGKNLANISEVTITSKEYLKSFRDKKYNYKDLYTGKNINEKGFVRDLSFFARHPQQTINHMGGVQSIILDVDNKNLKNRFARSALTFLSKEKNQAGVITVGKKTMLFRRGDHDGDKVSQAYVDFIKDDKVKNNTLSNALLEFQIKNNIFGEWDDTKGLYKKITGDLIDKEGNLIDLSKIENPLEIIRETLNITEEELNMKTKMLNNFSFSVEGRAYKELGKHYNAIYDIMANLSDFINNPIKVTANQLNSLEGAIRMSSDVKYHDMTKLNGKRLKDDAITVGSKYAKENIKTSLEVVDMLRSGNYKVSDLREKISGMDVLGATALFRVLKENKDISSEELFKKSYKDVDKFISRGSFDKFYAYKNTTGIFDELSGIRNTGETHSYATKLRLSGVELQKLDVTNVMEKIGSFGSYDKTNPETLREMIRKQKYYTGASDIFYDNMIESAISAKHGLTLGGLEGSKLFIKSLLSKDSSLLNKKTIRLFDEIYIDNSEKALLKFADTLLVFNEGYSKINKSLENVMDKVADSGLDKDTFLGSFEFDNEYYKKILKGNDVSKADIKKYLEYKDEYKSTMNTIEKNLFEEVKKIKNIDYLDFEMFKGIHLFGELMIQNEPNSEYDYSKIKDLLTSYRNNEIDFNELSNNYEFRKFKSQTYATLGTAAGISNVANLKEYADSFYKSYYTNNITNEFFNVISNKYDIDINNVASMFDKNLELKESKEELFSSEDLEGISKLSTRFKNQLDKRKVEFLTSLEKDSVTAYANILSKNITEFSNNGKAGEESLKIINNHLDNGMLSFNDSTYSYGIKELENAKNKRLSDISLFYSEYDDSFSELILGEGMESIDKNLHVGIISQAEKVVDEYMLKNVRENLRVVSVAETYSDEFVSILVDNKFHKLTDYDREMVSMGKAVILNGYKESDFKELERIVGSRSNVKFQFSNNGFLFPGGIADQESIDAIVKMYEKNGNLYIGESVANTIIKRSDKYRSMFEDSLFDKKKLIEELKLANIHLKEEITLDNVSRRLNTKFDSKLVARIKFSDYMNSNKDYFFELKKDKEQYKEFKRSFINNLENILSDFSKIDSRIKTTYVDDYYVNIANSLSQSNKKYKRMEEVLSSEDKVKSFKRLSSKLDNVLKENRDWLDTEDIDSDLFKKISTIELLRQFGENEVDVNKVILNSASAMNGKEYNYKTFKTSKAFIKDIVSNPKVAVGALGVVAGATLIKSITGASEPLKMPNGNYILGKTNGELSNNKVIGDLANGMLNNNPLEIQELGRNLDIPEYISILKKMYF